MAKRDVLRILREQYEPISGQKIAQMLSISREAVWASVQKLRRDGYAIVVKPKGYLLLKPTAPLSAKAIQSNMQGHPWQDRLTVLKLVDSTNDYAKRLAAEGAPEGTAVLAEAQQNGHGRRGRSFDSPAGHGIYLSVILRPQEKPTALLHLTAAVAEAVAEAVEAQTGLQVDIKWVNDLVAGEKKLGGILSEMSADFKAEQTNYIVVGIGLNCCQSAGAFPPELAQMATSIAAQTGVQPDRNALVAEILIALSRLRDTLMTERSDWIQRYASRCITIGKQVRVLRAGKARKAVALGINESAALAVEYSDGTREWISSGEVSVRGLYGYIS